VTVGELPSVTVVVDAEPTTRVSVPPSLSVPGAAPFDSVPVLDVVPAAKPDSAVGPASGVDPLVEAFVVAPDAAPVSSAHASPGTVALAMPTPSATASAPTRPTWRA
jgi:hypothetical protein